MLTPRGMLEALRVLAAGVVVGVLLVVVVWAWAEACYSLPPGR